MGAGRVMICLTCMTEIQSKGRHDWVACKCKNDSTRVFIDGGSDYERVGFGSKARWAFKDDPGIILESSP
jgi:hypothetical protein